MIKLRIIFLVHFALLTLAATHYTLPGWFGLGAYSWHIDFYDISKRSGFGSEYISEFNLAVVLGYLGAYLAGVAFYGLALRGNPRAGGWRRVLWLGLILSMLGAASFGIEATHWLWSHHHSWIFSLPSVLLILGLMNLRVALKSGTPYPMSQAVAD